MAGERASCRCRAEVLGSNTRPARSVWLSTVRVTLGGGAGPYREEPLYLAVPYVCVPDVESALFAAASLAGVAVARTVAMMPCCGMEFY